MGGACSVADLTNIGADGDVSQLAPACMQCVMANAMSPQACLTGAGGAPSGEGRGTHTTGGGFCRLSSVAGQY